MMWLLVVTKKRNGFAEFRDALVPVRHHRPKEVRAMSELICATPENESDRLAALQALEILDTDIEPEFDELVSLASAICETPIGLISLIDADRQWFKAQIGLEVRETPRAVAFCDHAIRQPESLSG